MIKKIFSKVKGSYFKLWMALLIMALISPLGIILPELMNSQGAWGEWGPAEIKQEIGYLPEKLSQIADLWQAPMPNYAIKNFNNPSLVHRSANYVLCALIGISACGLLGFYMGRVLRKK